MTTKEALKGIKQAIAEHLHKQTGENVEKHFEYLQYDTEIDIIDKALTELEDLRESNKQMRKLLDEAYSKIPSKNNCDKGDSIMKKVIKDVKIPETEDKFLNIAKNWISENNKKKLVKVLNMLTKEDKKQKNNDYVSSRDLYVIGCVLIGSTSLLLDGAKTTQSGRDDLLKIKESIYE